MSGSSGGGGNGVPEPQCETIGLTTDINSPQADALEGLEPSDVLMLSEQEGKVVAHRIDNEALVGSINWIHNHKLIQCMEEGYSYQAVVRSIDDGLVKVYVSVAK